jgi:hypothetical protein
VDRVAVTEPGLATEMGSRRRTKMCKTREEWKAYNEANRGRRH